MAEEFQAGVCGGSWWMNPSRNSLFAGGFSMSPCSGALGDVASLGWPTDIGFGLTPTSDWTQANLLLGRSTQSIFTTNMIQENGSDPATIRNPGPNFAGKVATVDQDSSTMDAFKQINQEFTTLDQSVNCTTPTTCQGLSTGFPVVSSNESNTNSCGYSSNMIKSFLLDEPPLNSMDYPPQSAMNSYGSSPDELSPPPPSFSKLSALLKPNTNSSLANSQAIGNNRMQFSNNTPFWNATAGVLDDVHSGFFVSSQPSSLVAASFDEKPNRASLLATKATSKYVHQVSASAGKKSSPEPAYKRPKIETPSPLPTFKVRKEKLGDRITALQQLVAPFGKTDTASVLQEAIEYIKFLHNQVDVLSTPYMKNGVPIQNQLQVSNKMKGTEGPKQDLRTQGLCLVPISSTFPVANETPADFWTPSFGGSFR